MKKQEEPIDRMLRWAEELGWTQTELAHRLGLESSAPITNWKNRERRLPPERYQRVADVFGRSVDELVGRVPERTNPLPMWSISQIPVRGTIRLGKQGDWHSAEHPLSGDGYIDMPSRDKDAYALRISGDALHPWAKSGRFLLIEPNTPASPEDEVLVQLKDGRNVVGELLFAHEDQVILQSLDPTHVRLTLRADEIEHISVVAAVARSAWFLPEKSFPP